MGTADCDAGAALLKRNFLNVRPRLTRGVVRVSRYTFAAWQSAAAIYAQSVPSALKARRSSALSLKLPNLAPNFIQVNSWSEVGGEEQRARR
jgi:hypothetical protein